MTNPPSATTTHGLFRKRSRFLGQASLAKDATANAVTHAITVSNARQSSATDRSVDSSSTSLIRSASLRPRRPKSPISDDLAYSHQADKRSVSSASTVPNVERSLDNLFRPPSSSGSVRPSRTSSFTQSVRKEEGNGIQTSGTSSHGVHSQAIDGPRDFRATFHHIQAMASKRMSTLDYLRKAHDGRVYWFNTLLFNQDDLAKMAYFDARKIGRRATNYLLLGLSIPSVLDSNSSTALGYLKTFNALLTEFETFASIHSPDGTSSSLTRARLPQMFRRHGQSTSSKSRRSGSIDTNSPQEGNESYGTRSFSGSGSILGVAAPFASFPSGEQELVPGEEYTLLLTPSLPFEPDYIETFATLCDVLIDCYTKIKSLVNSPEMCTPGVGDLFGKADAKIRKILVANVVKDFEEASKQGVRSEIAGIGKLVLGGLT